MNTAKKKPAQPKLRKIPLPAGYPALPKGSVFLGEVPAQGVRFSGWQLSDRTMAWVYAPNWLGGGGGSYAAPADSAIARMILGTPAKAAKKQAKAKKPSAVRKSVPAESVPTNSMKPLREWLEQLPDGYRERALRMAETEERLEYTLNSLIDAIQFAGHWEDSPEGHRFWNAVWAHYYYANSPSSVVVPQLPALPECSLPTVEVAPIPSADPKGHAGALKPQLALIPPTASEEMAKALACGAERYGPWNWRGTGVEAMTYLHAMRRHIDRYLDGEDIDPDSGVHHLGHVMAGCGIVLDARKHGTLIDNRPPIPRTDAPAS